MGSLATWPPHTDICGRLVIVSVSMSSGYFPAKPLVFFYSNQTKNNIALKFAKKKQHTPHMADPIEKNTVNNKARIYFFFGRWVGGRNSVVLWGVWHPLFFPPSPSPPLIFFFPNQDTPDPQSWAARWTLRSGDNCLITDAMSRERLSTWYNSGDRITVLPL